MSQVPKKRLMVLIGLLVLAGGVAWVPTVLEPKEPEPDLLFERIRKELGLRKYSEWHEESLIRHFFKDRRDGFFLDVGAAYYMDASTTYFLEKHLGWKGIAIDALEEYRADYEKFRPGTRFFSYFVSDRSSEQVDFYRGTNQVLMSSGRKELTGNQPTEKRVVSTITLDDLLAREKVARVDFVSLDIEGFEVKALAGFDIQRYQPALLAVEVREETIKALREYFALHGYVELTRYARIDHVNRWFARKDDPRVAEVEREP